LPKSSCGNFVFNFHFATLVVAISFLKMKLPHFCLRGPQATFLAMAEPVAEALEAIGKEKTNLSKYGY
jgi:hypothetical protein